MFNNFGFDDQYVPGVSQPLLRQVDDFIATGHPYDTQPVPNPIAGTEDLGGVARLAGGIATAALIGILGWQLIKYIKNGNHALQSKAKQYEYFVCSDSKSDLDLSKLTVISSYNLSLQGAIMDGMGIGMDTMIISKKQAEGKFYVASYILRRDIDFVDDEARPDAPAKKSWFRRPKYGPIISVQPAQKLKIRMLQKPEPKSMRVVTGRGALNLLGYDAVPINIPMVNAHGDYKIVKL